MTPRTSNPDLREGICCLAVLLFFSANLSGQSRIALPTVGAVRGQLADSEPDLVFDSIQALLMPPEWALVWRGEVQQRLDAYSQTYKRSIAEDPDLFREISAASYREATSDVMARMQSAMGADFADWLRPVSSDGRFEFEGLRYGEYSVVVVARTRGRAMLWAESFDVNSPVSLFLDIEHRVQ